MRRCGSIAGRTAWLAVGIAWRTGRLLLGAFLVLVEPLVRITLVPLAYLGVVVSLLFGFVMHAPHFPRWGMLALSVGALVLYWVYLALVDVVLGGHRGRH